MLGATYARRPGAPELLTWNDADNAAILALDRRLGYRVAAATRHVAKDLGG